MSIPDNLKKKGRPFKHALPDQPPVTVKEIVLSDDYSWERKRIAEGAKGPIYADIKVIKAVACRSTTRYGNYLAPEEDVWVYIRRYDDGKLKYFLSNATMNHAYRNKNVHSLASSYVMCDDCPLIFDYLSS